MKQMDDPSSSGDRFLVHSVVCANRHQRRCWVMTLNNTMSSAAAASKAPVWSPFTCCPKSSLTPSGLLELDTDDGEVELVRRETVELRSDGTIPLGPKPPNCFTDYTDRTANLTVVLTTHRLVFLQQSGISSSSGSPVEARFVHLSNAHVAESAGGTSMFSFASPKIVLSTYSFPTTLLLCFKAPSGALQDRDSMLKSLHKALERKAWESAARLAAKKKQQNQPTKARKVGVDAILSSNAARHKQAKKLTDTAFQGDAETLLREAAELVTIIQKYASTLEQSNGNSSDDKTSDKDAVKLSDMMTDMGMASALSNKPGGDRHGYYELLARQLADFLRPRLRKAGGVLTLTDVYCLYNRARGTNLIAPDDLVKAVPLLKKLRLGMAEVVFPSGVRVVQEDAFDDAEAAQRFVDMAGKNNSGSITAMQVSREMHIPSLLAQEQLHAAERMGYLCRDVTLETTRFYPNRFREWTPSRRMVQ